MTRRYLCGLHHFGGTVQVLLCDRSRCLVAHTDRATGAATFTPALLQFCRDWQLAPRACAPYRARTKGKVESSVKYAKRNGLARRAFSSFSALEAHLAQQMDEADRRVHGTTHERPLERFERDERALLRPPATVDPHHVRVVRRRVANDAFVDIDTALTRGGTRPEVVLRDDESCCWRAYLPGGNFKPTGGNA